MEKTASSSPDKTDEISSVGGESDSDDELEEVKFPKNIIVCNNVTKDYEIGDFIVKAVDSADFKIKRGDFVAIQGHSGAGKTTLLHMMAGLEKPSQGDIFIEWVRISSLDEEMRATFRVLNLGFVFQNYNLISSLTADENIRFPMQLADIDLGRQKERVTHLLESVKLMDRGEHLSFQLSAGEQQRVGIARALANDPPIIIADEPTANLDKKSSDIIADLFIELNKEGKTIIVATHDDRLLNHAYRIITMEDARISDDKRLKEPELRDEADLTAIKIPEEIKENRDG